MARYCEIDVLAALESRTGSETAQTVELAFDQLLTRLQALRFDDEDSQRRKKLQRFVERLRRAQKHLAVIID